MGVVRRWQRARAAAVIGECGTGKTLMALAAIHCHAQGRPYASCLPLMGKKLLVSLAMEGKFSAEGLQALDDGDDMLTAMARELVNEQRIGESADAVWRQIQAEQSKMLPVEDRISEPIESPPSEPSVTWAPIPQLTPLTQASLLTFDSRLPANKVIRRKRRATLMSGQDQLALF